MIKTKNSLFEALDMTSLPQEEQEEMLLDLQELVYRGTLIKLIERMDESAQEQFNTFLDTNPDEDTVLAYLYEKVSDADALVAEVISEIQNDILEATDTK